MNSLSMFRNAALDWINSFDNKTTKDTYKRDFSLWDKYCQEHGVNPEAPSKAEANAFRDMLTTKYASLTTRRILSCLSSAYAELCEDMVNPFSPKRVKRPSAADFDPTDAVSDEDARKVIAAAASVEARTRFLMLTRLRNVALLWVLWTTGMRRISIVTVERDVIRQDGKLYLRHKVKGGAKVRTQLPAEAVEAVETWLAEAPESKWLFCVLRDQKADGQSRQLKALHPKTVTSIVAKAAHDAGIHVHPHQFRSALITEAINAELSIVGIRAAVHHKKLESTIRYDRGNRGDEVIEKVAAYRARKQRTP